MKLSKRNMFDDKPEAIINTVNCSGVMGGGLALLFKNRHAGMYRLYRKACAAGEVKVGEMWVWENKDPQYPYKWVINFPTKDQVQFDSKMIYITKGLKGLVKTVRTLQPKSLAVPALGAALGGLEWEKVYPAIVKGLTCIDDETKITIYAPLDVRKYT